jgi:hypothetical protein
VPRLIEDFYLARICANLALPFSDLPKHRHDLLRYRDFEVIVIVTPLALEKLHQ